MFEPAAFRIWRWKFTHCTRMSNCSNSRVNVVGSNVGSSSSSSSSVVMTVVIQKIAVRNFQGLKLTVPYVVTLAKHTLFHRLSIYYVRTRQWYIGSVLCGWLLHGRRAIYESSNRLIPRQVCNCITSLGTAQLDTILRRLTLFFCFIRVFPYTFPT
jgi:hypothetical protein